MAHGQTQSGMWSHYYIPRAGTMASGLKVFKWAQRAHLRGFVSIVKKSYLFNRDYLRKLGVTCGHFPDWRAAWCGACFIPHESEPQQIRMSADFYETSLEELDDQQQFMEACPGDHLCASFQGPNCQSQSIRHRNLEVGVSRDEIFKCLCIQATLDAFWSHSSNTVKSHLRKVAFMVPYSEALGGPLGPLHWAIIEGCSRQFCWKQDPWKRDSTK